MNKMTKWLMCGLIICAFSIVGCSNMDDAESEVKSIEPKIRNYHPIHD